MSKNAINVILINLFFIILILIIIIFLFNEYYKVVVIPTKVLVAKKEYKIQEEDFNGTNIEEVKNDSLQDNSNANKKYPKEEIIENYNRI